MEDVNKAPQSTEPVVEEATKAEPQGGGDAPGSKTDPTLLLKSLQEEREKRQRLEEELALLKTSVSSDVFSDEGKVLQQRIKDQDSKIESILQDNAKKDILILHPIMREKWEEFETFRNNPENKGMNLRTATKAFLLENGLYEPTRKGLEKTTGGQRVPTNQGMSVEDIKALRETNFRKYQDMLEKGLLKV
jgi:hypothetical protein